MATSVCTMPPSRNAPSNRTPQRAARASPRRAARAEARPFEPYGEEVIDRIVAEWASVLPGDDRAAREITASVLRIATLIEKETQRVLAHYGLLDTEFRLLGGLRRAGPPFCRSPSELSPRYVPVTSGGMTGVIDRLARRRLVRRLTNPTDGRGILVELTADGRVLIERVMASVAERQALLVHGLGEEPDRRQAASLLRRLLRAANVAFGASPFD
jgi:DNA-binding MarR family transcriptional regulator